MLALRYQAKESIEYHWMVTRFVVCSWDTYKIHQISPSFQWQKSLPPGPPSTLRRAPPWERAAIPDAPPADTPGQLRENGGRLPHPSCVQWGVTLWLCQNSYWKLPFIVDLPIENGGSFHSYVSLPEGITGITHIFFGSDCLWKWAMNVIRVICVIRLPSISSTG